MRYGLMALVAVAALVAGCGAPTPSWNFGPATASPAPGASATSVPAPATSSAVAESTPGTAGSSAPGHFDKAGLAFDYPASWKVDYPDFDMHYSRIVAFLGTGSASAGCTPVGDNGQQCGPEISVGPGQLIVEVSDVGGPPRISPIDPSDPAPIADGARYVTVAGLPAITGDEPAAELGVDRAIGWTLTKPGSVGGRYGIDVRMRGPGLDAMQAQVDALIASITYDPPVPVLNPADGPAALKAALTEIRAGDPSFQCFPLTPGASAEAVVRQLPGLSPLSRDLAVTCSSSIEPTKIGLWKATLLVTWPKTADHDAGKTGEILWIGVDGEAGTMTGIPDGSEKIPYWN